MHQSQSEVTKKRLAQKKKTGENIQLGLTGFILPEWIKFVKFVQNFGMKFIIWMNVSVVG